MKDANVDTLMTSQEPVGSLEFEGNIIGSQTGERAKIILILLSLSHGKEEADSWTFLHLYLACPETGLPLRQLRLAF